MQSGATALGVRQVPEPRQQPLVLARHDHVLEVEIGSHHRAHGGLHVAADPFASGRVDDRELIRLEPEAGARPQRVAVDVEERQAERIPVDADPVLRHALADEQGFRLFARDDRLVHGPFRPQRVTVERICDHTHQRQPQGTVPPRHGDGLQRHEVRRDGEGVPATAQEALGVAAVSP